MTKQHQKANCLEHKPSHQPQHEFGTETRENELKFCQDILSKGKIRLIL